MEFWDSLLDIGLVLAVALFLGALCERMRQSAILGYLLAGALLGPNALDLVTRTEDVTGLAEVGVSLLLFSIGLEFSWRRLRMLGIAAIGGGTFQIALTLAVVAAVATLCGETFRAAIVLGAACALSSTAGVLRLLMSRAEIDSTHGRYSVGILLFQDLAVIPLVLLTDLLANPGSGTEALAAFGRTALALTATAVGFWVIFNFIAPRILHVTTLLRNRELPVLFAVVGAMGATWGAHAMGIEPAMGAFIAGMLLAESPFATQVRADLASLRTLLVTLFFSSIGMLADPSWMLEHIGTIALIVLGVVVVKPLIVWGVLRLLRQRSEPALAAGLCLAQVGEFSFVLAGMAKGTILDDDGFMALISSMMLTLFLTPILVSRARPISAFVVRTLAPRRPGAPARDAPAETTSLRRHFVVVGFGPAGERVACVLRDRGLDVHVLDMNPKLAQTAKERGFASETGDATHPDVLEHLHVASAAAVVVSIPDPQAAMGILRFVRSIAPRAVIVARSRYHRHSAELEAAGADVVVDEEEQVGESLGERVLALLGREAEAGEPPPSAAGGA